MNKNIDKSERNILSKNNNIFKNKDNIYIYDLLTISSVQIFLIS